MAKAQQHRLIGQVIAGRYRVEELLGEGGMGAVYIAQHLSLDKPVALKIVHPEHAGNAEHAARFAREAMATSRIDHPNVISALDFGTLPDGTAYLAVQLVRGPSLSKVLESIGRIPWVRACEIAAQVADALSAAQAHGIVHRDLKPDNVLLQQLDDGGEIVKVLDFGVAKFARESLEPRPISSEPRQVTQVGLVIGTPGYMSPEQALGGAADVRSDLYALGVMLWEMIAGRPLWEGTDLQAIVEKQLAGKPPSVREAAGDPTIPASLEELLELILARRAEDRPAEAGYVRDRLREIIEIETSDPMARARSGSRKLRLRTPTVSGKVDLPRIEVITTPPATVDPPRAVSQRAKSSRTARSIAVVVSVLLAAVVLLVLSGQIVLKPQRKVAEVAEQVATGLHLPEPVIEALRDAKLTATKTGLPESLEPAFQSLVEAEERDERVDAANALLSHLPPDEVPSYVRRMAYLQLARTCNEKKAEIEELAKIGDPRALPLLVRIAQRPRSGCGRKHREDCLACLREPLDALIEALEKKRGSKGAGSR